MSEAAPTYALVNGAACRFALKQGGPRAVVLVHELGGSLESWDGLLALLAPDLTVLRYDLRGAGMSEKVRGTNDADLLADDLAALADHCGLPDHLAVIGSAMGAALAARFATRHPDRVEALVLIGPALGVPPERRQPAHDLTLKIEAHGMRSIADDLLPRAFPVNLWSDEEARNLVIARWLGADPEGYAANYRVLIETDFRPELASVQVPALVLAGRFDPFGTPEAIDAGTSGLPQRDFRIIGGGHFMALQSPALVAPPINDFLDALQ
jgi:3-oxoadipate enol-lactonase